MPGMRDLDFGRQFAAYAEALDWPAGVVVEDLSYAPHLALHRLRELSPASVVFVGSVKRASDTPGTVRRYRPKSAQSDPDDVHLSLTAGLGGTVELDHTLRVLHHWGALPADTVIVEVEPGDISFGTGFSEEVGASIDEIVDIVRAEVATDVEPQQSTPSPLTAEDISLAAELRDRDAKRSIARTGPGDIGALAEYARLHDRVNSSVTRFRQSVLPRPPDVPGLAVAARSRQFGRGLHAKGDWYDFFVLSDGWVGVVMGDVAERGLEAAIATSQLRSAAWTCASTLGLAPGELVASLDGVVRDTGAGVASTVVYMALNVVTGEARMANAGHCPPFLQPRTGTGGFVDEGLSAPLGIADGGPGPRPQATLVLPPEWTLLVYTDGLLADEPRRGDPMERLSSAVSTGCRDVDDLSDDVMSACLAGMRRRDDASLLVLRRS